MIKKRVAINGFGRIGRLTFRNLIYSDQVDIVAINDLTDNRTLAYLLTHDSAQGNFDVPVSSDDDSIVVDGKYIHAYSEKDPEKLPWAELKVDIVLECTGRFRTKETAAKHLTAGAKKVVISAPGKDDSFETVVLGVNNDKDDLNAFLFSNASCTTNCLAPIAFLIHNTWGIETGMMTTVHAYTADQRLQDSPHKDLRRARAAAVNIVPTTTGAANATVVVIPELKGKLKAIAIRVPVISGSLVDLNVVLNKSVTVDEVNRVFKEASKNAYEGIIEYSEDHLVSSDIIGNPHSCIFDSLMTTVSGNMLKVICWYDNEAGYSARLADLTEKLPIN